MSELESGMSCTLKEDTITVNGDLKISFRRTVRVPDTSESNYLPPNLGAFPLEAVSRHSDNLPKVMVVKSGVFFPMYQSEAMWINFSPVQEHMHPYKIKIYVGGVNVVSAEPALETKATAVRRQVRLGKAPADATAASPLQDYIVVPQQKWIDGVANGDGTVRQFIAMPSNSGTSVEAQITGQEATAGIQIEVTPYKLSSPRPFPGEPIQIFLKQLNGTTKTFNVTRLEPIANFKLRIREATGIPTQDMRLIYAGKQLEDARDFDDYRIYKESTIHMVLRLRGAGPPDPSTTAQMNLAAGGLIHQVVHADTLRPNWDVAKTTVFNAQILNASLYEAVTGMRPITRPISHEEYAEHGFPYFKIYEEKSGVYGTFGVVKSLGEGKGKGVVSAVRVVDAGCGSGIEVMNPLGPYQVSESVAEIGEKLEGYHIAEF
ncbi:integral membrane protein [Alternaria rosae]|uniref:uncharacterized protein n=1 Tax=Alternaria rosae TaxID=1187941 RepID=UPI001E8DA05E|nr:uncharacterized protein BKA58DRAFT_458640 [Alternaria rosae]KAH6868018.1 integral membrane protein [Alternaria rosae]